MCRTQCVLALATLYLGLVHSWDIAVSLGDQLEFYTDGIKTDTVLLKSYNLTKITYDEIRNMMLFVDKQRDNDAICGYDLTSKSVRCFVKRYGSDIHDIAFDPATDSLFFTDKKNRSINWISLKDSGSENTVYGNLLIDMVDQIPSDIEVDSCNGFIYWTNTEPRRNGNYMERARFNGSERYVVARITPVKNFAIDPQTQKNYFLIGSNYDLLSKHDLRVNNIMVHREIIFFNKPPSIQELTVSKDYLYWTQSNASDKTVWQASKSAGIFPLKSIESIKNLTRTSMYRFFTEHKLGLAANYRIKDQVHGLQDCEALVTLIPILETEQTTELGWSTEDAETSGSIAELDWSTVTERNSKLYEALAKAVLLNETGELDWTAVETSETEIRTELTCNAGYSGARCEVYACQGFCLNSGVCSLNKQEKPVCQCVGNYEGSKCEAVKKDTFSYTSTPQN